MNDTGNRLHERGPVIVVDGTGVAGHSCQAWPQPNNQKPGCGFPQANDWGLAEPSDRFSQAV